jgi:hypothetical protein
MTRCMTGFKTRRDACSAVGIAGARMVHAIPTMLALGAALDGWSWSSLKSCRDPRRAGRRDDVAVVPADDKSIAISPVWRNPGFAVPERARAANFVPSP